MNKEARKVPRIRFKGFTDDWEQRKASDIFTSISNKNHVELPVLSASQEKGMVFRSQNGIDIKYDKDNISNYKKVKPGQFVIHLRSFQSGFAYSEVEGITSPAYTIIDFKNPTKDYPQFWKEVFAGKIFIKRLESITYGIRDGRSISFSDFTSLKFLTPKYEEQKRVGKLLIRLDQTIALHQRKLDLLKKQKAFFLKNMFPGNNSNRPNLRFNKFTDKWEFQELGKVALITMGQSPDSKNYTSNPSDNILVQGNADMKNGHVSPRVWTTQITKRAEKGDLILSVRAPVGDVGKTEFDVVLGRGVAAIKGNEFLFQLLNKINEDKYWAKYSTGSTFESINSTEIIKAKINIPNESEQITIGNFLEQVDKLITLNRKKLVQSKKIKEVFLQNIFV